MKGKTSVAGVMLVARSSAAVALAFVGATACGEPPPTAAVLEIQPPCGPFRLLLASETLRLNARDCPGPTGAATHYFWFSHQGMPDAAGAMFDVRASDGFALQPALTLLNEALDPVAFGTSDADSAKLMAVIPAGSFWLQVSARAPGQAGNYTLTASIRSPGTVLVCQNEPWIAAPIQFEGDLSSGCFVYGGFQGNRTYYVQPFRLWVRGGQVITAIFARSGTSLRYATPTDSVFRSRIEGIPTQFTADHRYSMSLIRN